MTPHAQLSCCPTDIHIYPTMPLTGLLCCGHLGIRAAPLINPPVPCQTPPPVAQGPVIFYISWLIWTWLPFCPWSRFRTLIVVINDELADNHQMELAKQLQESGYLAYATCSTVAGCVMDVAKTDLSPYT